MASPEKPHPKQPGMDVMDKNWQATHKAVPKWSMAGKPEMIIGDSVPSWTRSIPGPKYSIETDKYKKRAPAWAFRPEKPDGQKKMSNSASAPSKLITTDQMEAGYKATTKQPPKWSLGTKPALIPGDAVPSWVKSIPGPKYNPDPDKFLRKPPVYSIGTKLNMVIGGEIPSWVNSIPGPKYKVDTDIFKHKQPVYTIGTKLKTEGEIMSTRSPGPIYGGSAIDAVAQSKVDSSKRRTCAPSFGIGPRFGGQSYEMVLSGAWSRYEHGRYAF
jgi:hypothetical protein